MRKWFRERRCEVRIMHVLILTSTTRNRSGVSCASAAGLIRPRNSCPRQCLDSCHGRPVPIPGIAAGDPCQGFRHNFMAGSSDLDAYPTIQQYERQGVAFNLGAGQSMGTLRTPELLEALVVWARDALVWTNRATKGALVWTKDVEGAKDMEGGVVTLVPDFSRLPCAYSMLEAPEDVEVVKGEQIYEVGCTVGKHRRSTSTNTDFGDADSLAAANTSTAVMATAVVTLLTVLVLVAVVAAAWWISRNRRAPIRSDIEMAETPPIAVAERQGIVRNIRSQTTISTRPTPTATLIPLDKEPSSASAPPFSATSPPLDSPTPGSASSAAAQSPHPSPPMFESVDQFTALGATFIQHQYNHFHPASDRSPNGHQRLPDTESHVLPETTLGQEPRPGHPPRRSSTAP